MNKRLLVLAHAPSKNTQAMKDAVLRGARHPDIGKIDTHWLAPLQAGPENVSQVDGIILGTTENLAYMSGALKDFFDRSYYPLLDKTQGLPCAVYIRAGNDGTGTRRALESILTGLCWKICLDILVCRGPWQNEFLQQCEELGMSMAAGLEAGIF